MKTYDVRLRFDDLPEKSLLRPEEVAGFLSVSLRTVYRWYEMGLIQGTRLNRSVRIFRESVIKQVKERQNE
jgi:excisionase family DNA binding protein